MVNPQIPGWFNLVGALGAIVSVVGTLVMLAVVAGVIVLLVRFLLVGTRAAQLYVANNAPKPGPSDAPGSDQGGPAPAASAAAAPPRTPAGSDSAGPAGRTAPSPSGDPRGDFGSSQPAPPVAAPTPPEADSPSERDAAIARVTGSIAPSGESTPPTGGAEDRAPLVDDTNPTTGSIPTPRSTPRKPAGRAAPRSASGTPASGATSPRVTPPRATKPRTPRVPPENPEA